MYMVCVVFKLHRIRKHAKYWFWFSFICFNDHYTTEEHKLPLYVHYKYFDRNILYLNLYIWAFKSYSLFC